MTNDSSYLSVAVVGAGVAGLTVARQLLDVEHTVQVFDKGRGAGGRMSTRRQDGYEFDHGAQFFTVREESFRREVEEWRSTGLVADWSGSIVTLSRGSFESENVRRERLVAVPRMSALCKSLADPMSVTFGTRVSDVAREDGKWVLRSDAGLELGVFDRVVVNTPPAQASPLLVESPELAARAAVVEMLPCWAAMVTFDPALSIEWDGAFVSDSPLSWIGRNSSKPGRPAQECWVLHGSPQWSVEHLGFQASEVAEILVNAFFEATLCAAQAPVSTIAHRWRYARVEQSLGEDYLYNAELGIGVCGDWCRGDRVEDAFLSGLGLSRRMAEQ